MPTSIVIGGQYGSEAKGKAAIHYTQKWIRESGEKLIIGVRCGGPNAGHTIFPNNGPDKFVLRLVPSLVTIPEAILVICAGSLINVDLLLSELESLDKLGLKASERLIVDPMAAIVDFSAIEMEIEAGLGTSLGSTVTGTGGATAIRAMRKAKLARDIPELQRFTKKINIPTSDFLTIQSEAGYLVMIEGTQGCGLDLYHSGHYPFCTSKSTNASSFLTEAGIPMGQVLDTIMVIRTYPIRVGGNSGPLPNEITWGEIAERSGKKNPLIEMTSVTKKVRRVGEFDMDQVKRSALLNTPTEIMVHGMDYLNVLDYGVKNYQDLSIQSKEFIEWISDETQTTVTAAFTGVHQNDIVEIEIDGY